MKKMCKKSVDEYVNKQIEVWANVVSNTTKEEDIDVMVAIYHETNKDMRMEQMRKGKMGSQPCTDKQLGLIRKLKGDLAKASDMSKYDASEYIDQLMKEKQMKED